MGKYIGSTPQYGILTKQDLVPNGVTTTYSLDYQVGSAESMLVVYGGVVQTPNDDYTIASGGSQIVFAVAKAGGFDLYVLYLAREITTPVATNNFIGSVTITDDLSLGGPITITGASPSIRTNTSDGSDSKSISLNSSGATTPASTRGAWAQVYGNEAPSNGGRIILQTGNVSTGHIYAYLNNASSKFLVLDSSANPLWSITGANITQEAYGDKLVFTRYHATNNYGIEFTNSSRTAVIKPTAMGYSSGYRTLMIGSAASNPTVDAVSLWLNVDLSANASGSFGGDGTEIFVRNGATVVSPNTGNNGYHRYLTVQNGSITINGSSILSQNGTAALPSYSFVGDPDTGIYQGGANILGLSTAGLARYVVNASGELSQDATNGGDIRINKTGSAIRFAANGFVLGQSGASLALGSNALTRFTIDTSGNYVQDATNGGYLTISRDAYGINAVSDSLSVNLAGGTTPGSANGSAITVQGNSFGGSNLGGNIILNGGFATSGGRIELQTRDASAARRRWYLTYNSGDLLQDSTYGARIIMPRALNTIDTGILLGASARVADQSPAALTVISDVTFNIQALFQQSTADVNGNLIYFNKTRKTDNTADTIVVNGDAIATLIFQGADGAAFRQAATIKAYVDGTPGAGSMPGALSFTTTPTGTVTPLNRWTIDSTGSLIQDSTNGNHIIQSKALTTHMIAQGLTSIPSDISAQWYAPFYSHQSTTVGTHVFSYGANNSTGVNHYLVKTRDTTGNANVVVQSGDVIGTYGFVASDGGDFQVAAGIRALVDGTPGAADMPGRLEFMTTTDGTNTLNTRWAIDSAGNLNQNSTAGGSIFLNRSASGVVIANTTSVPLQTGQQIRLYNGSSGATKPTNTQLEIETAANGGANISNSAANTSGYYFSNPSAAYDGGIEYGNTSRALLLRSAAAARWSLDSSGNLIQDATNGGSIVISKSSTGVILGATSQNADVIAAAGTSSLYSLSNNSSGANNASFIANGVNGTGVNIWGFKNRAASGAAASSIVNAGDTLVTLAGLGADGIVYRRAGQISIEVDATPGSGDMPGRIVFSTTPDAAASPVTRWTIDSTGALLQNSSTGGDIIISKNGSGIRKSGTADVLHLSGGDTLNTSAAGAGLSLFGSTGGGSQGIARIFGGNQSTGHVEIQTIHASAELRLITNSVNRVIVTGAGSLNLEKTNTTAGTTGAQTINKMSGSVNFAAAATSLVVTNSLVSASSNILCTVQNNDATMKSVSCTPTAGSFTINANAAATAETRVVFLVLN